MHDDSAVLKKSSSLKTGGRAKKVAGKQPVNPFASKNTISKTILKTDNKLKKS